MSCDAMIAVLRVDAMYKWSYQVVEVVAAKDTAEKETARGRRRRRRRGRRARAKQNAEGM